LKVSEGRASERQTLITYPLFEDPGARPVNHGAARHAHEQEPRSVLDVFVNIDRQRRRRRPMDGNPKELHRILRGI
jgi:hypothetical protein